MDREKIRVLLIDDKEVFREGLARILHEQSNVEIVYQSSGIGSLERIEEIRPQMVLISDTISQHDCKELVEQIIDRAPQTKIAMLTSSRSEEGLYNAMEAGASGYLLKDMKLEDLLNSISLLADGEVVVSKPLAHKLVEKFGDLRNSSPYNAEGISEREIEILKLLGKGATNSELAETLFITENTAKVHVKNILEKLQLKNRQQAAAYAVQHGLLKDDGENDQQD
ncbi:MAG: response regulator transcription factor [Dehalococcoidales bacterium]